MTRLSGFLTLALLVGATLIAYHNAWPDVLVHDDKYFAGVPRAGEWADLRRFFTDDLWAATGAESGLYRPLLLLSLAVESRVYGDWYAGYHLDNILLHLLVTLVVYGFLREVARVAARPEPASDLYPLLAALVFAVHPVNTEVVNSIFNRSEMMVALAGTGGLWWFLRFLQAHPAGAWTGLAVCYAIALLAKESAITLPAIAVALALILTPGPWTERARKGLPVFWLLVALGLYFLLRAQAFAASGASELGAEPSTSSTAELPAVFSWIETSSLRWMAKTIAVWGQGIMLLIWPDPILLYRSLPSTTQQWVLVPLQAALLLTAILRFRRGHYALLAALVFYYAALLPASRIGLTGYATLLLADRYLYFPWIGLCIALASGFGYLGRRFGPRAAVMPALIALAVLTPLTLSRNADWSSEVRLFDTELRRGNQGPNALRLATAAYLRAGEPRRAAEVCDSRPFEKPSLGRYANHCAIAYNQLGRYRAAERAFLAAVKIRPPQPAVHVNLARFYLQRGRRADAVRQFERAIEVENSAHMRVFRKGEMLVALYPRNRGKLREAREQFSEALRLQPGLTEAEAWLGRLDRALGSPR